MEYTLPKEESMPRQQKTYTREFKLEAVQLVKSSGKPLSQVARDLLISDSASDPRLWMGIRSQLPSPLAARFTATGFAGQEEGIGGGGPKNPVMRIKRPSDPTSPKSIPSSTRLPSV